MKQTTLFYLFALLCLNVNAQETPDLGYIADSITADAKILYRSEMASWYGTDIFMERSKDKSKAKGYFSYLTPQASRCVFFTGDEVPKVIGSIDFDSTYNVNTAVADFAERDFSEAEKEIYSLRAKALNIFNTDTFFKHYNNTNLNIIPIIINGEKRVYALTGTGQKGVIIFGNDYLLQFDNNNELSQKRRLHNSLISSNYGKQEDGNQIVGGMHSHIIDDFVTATDLCTLMLYAPLTQWQQYTVVSKDFLSIWNSQSNQLVIITKAVMEKINSDQKKRKKKEKD